MKLGLIGGSGLYDLPGLEQAHRLSQETPWGFPSHALTEGEVAGLPVVFLPRHGLHHSIAPADINVRANIAALKARGCTAVLSVSAVGSFRDVLPPGSLAIPHQIVDRTHGRARSFFGQGLVAHVSLADPISVDLAGRVAQSAEALAIPHRDGGTYLTIEGPQFATRAESKLARAQGFDVVGMTAGPEAALAREAEMAYAVAGFVTDYDSWRDGAAGVATADILAVLDANRAQARDLIAAVAANLAASPLRLPSAEGWERALDGAIVTPRAHWPVEAAARLRAIAPRLFDGPDAP
jgi:5'-methylthioadenosine phosphorylase